MVAPMRTLFTVALTSLALPLPLTAQLTTSYSGVQKEAGKTVPATARFSVQDGKIAMIMTGLRSARLLFDQKAQVLHVVSDDDKKYFDLDQKGVGEMSGMMATMQAQLAKMPAEQRAMAEQMMKSAMGKSAEFAYVRTNDKLTVLGYECTRVEGMRGTDKVTEYCGSKSTDFKISGDERQTILDMQGYLRNFTITVKSADDATRAFQWDYATDGYPVITRCFRNGEMTLDLKLDSLSRKPVAGSLFEIPGGYQKMDINSMMRGR
jgi:hypothetical protein